MRTALGDIALVIATTFPDESDLTSIEGWSDILVLRNLNAADVARSSRDHGVSYV